MDYSYKEKIIKKVNEKIKQDAVNENPPELLNENEKKILNNQGIIVDEDHFGIDFDFDLDTDFSSYTKLPNTVMRFLKERGNLIYRTKSPAFKFERQLHKVKTKIFKLEKGKYLSESLNSLCEFIGSNKRIVFYAAYINYKYITKTNSFEETLIVRFAEV